MSSTAFSPSVLTLPQMGVNKLINGNFDVWQRGTTPQTSSGYGSDDRWQNTNIGSTKTHSQQTFTLGQADVPNSPRYFSRTVVTTVASAGNYVQKAQAIEGVRTFAGQTATLSFWAKADSSKNIAIEFTQGFGSGGSPSASITGIGVTTCSLTSSWKKFTVTVSMPSISGKTIGTNNDDFMGVNFWFDAGSTYNARTNSLGQQSGTFDIAQVQLEVGSSATAFEQRQIGYELLLCQRYYFRSSPQAINAYFGSCGFISSTTNAVIIVNYPVQMRIAPTAVETTGTATDYVVRHGGGTTTCSAVPSGGGTALLASLDFVVASGLTLGQAAVGRAATTAAYLGFSAEL